MPYIGNDLATQFQAFATQTITGDGSTGYTLDRAVANGKELLVYINNVKQEEGSGKSYTATGTTITFSEAVASGDSCYLVYMGSAQQTVTAPAGSIVSSQFSSADLVLPKTVTIGSAGAEDTKLVFDGNAQDFHIGLDDSSDSLTIGLGSTLGTTSHMVIDANGHITKPLQPAFQVHPSGTVSDLSINTDNAIAFGTERFDNNGDFASDTFTAPVTGKYQLNIIMYFVDMPNDAAYVETYIITSNKTYYLIVDPSSFDQVQSYYTFDAGILADMDANDTCVIKVRQSGGTNQMDVSAASNFSGYLVC
jgi:hypothetical protein